MRGDNGTQGRSATAETFPVTTKTLNLKRDICSLFEVHNDENGVQRIVTPLEYTGSGDRIVVRVRPRGERFQIDENGEAAFLASLNGGSTDSELVARWISGLVESSPVSLDEDETLIAEASDERLLAPYVLKVAAAAQQLYCFATARAERQQNDFRERLAEVVKNVVEQMKLPWRTDITLPIMGDLIADHVLGNDENPLIVIAAHSPARLLEAEIIHMQYRRENKPGYVLAVAEDQASVTKKQFERASYFTDKTVVFEPNNFGAFIRTEAPRHVQ